MSDDYKSYEENDLDEFMAYSYTTDPKNRWLDDDGPLDGCGAAIGCIVAGIVLFVFGVVILSALFGK